MERETKCLVCGTVATRSADFRKGLDFYECPVCGRYEVSPYGLASCFDLNHLASYLVYHRFAFENVVEYRYHTTLSKEACDKYQEEFEQGKKLNGHPVHMNGDIVENWYPKTFSERVDKGKYQEEAAVRVQPAYRCAYARQCFCALYLHYYQYSVF